MKAKGTYKVKKWEENQYEQISAEMKMTKASVEYLMNGEIAGNAFVEYLMFYKHFDPNDQHKSSAVYVGLIKFAGSINGKQGSLVMQDHGSFENGEASSNLQIVVGSGFGEFKNITGTGKYSATQGRAQIELLSITLASLM